jgi:hypothetical protein
MVDYNTTFRPTWKVLLAAFIPFSRISGARVMIYCKHPSHPILPNLKSRPILRDEKKSENYTRKKAGLVQDFKNSGISMAAYFRKQNVSNHSFIAWLLRISSKGRFAVIIPKQVNSESIVPLILDNPSPRFTAKSLYY